MIVGFKSPTGKLIRFEDYKSRLDELDFPEPLLNLMAKEINNNPHQGKYVSVTTIIGCLRNTYLSRIYDIFINPRNAWFTMRGTLIHSILEGNKEDKNFLIEKNLKINMDNNHPLYGRIDRYNINKRHLTDFKTVGDNGLKFILQEGAKKDHIKQVNIYRYLLQKNGYPVDTISIIYMSMMDVVETGKKFFQIKKNEVIEYNIPNIELYPTESIKSFCEKRANLLYSAFETGLLPPPPDKETQKWLCSTKYCSTTDICPFYNNNINKEL